MYDLRQPVKAAPRADWANLTEFKSGVIIARTYREHPLYDVRLDDGTLLNALRPVFAKERTPYLVPVAKP